MRKKRLFKRTVLFCLCIIWVLKAVCALGCRFVLDKEIKEILCVSVWSSAGGRILRGGDVVKKSGLLRALTSRQAQAPRILRNLFFSLSLPLKRPSVSGLRKKRRLCRNARSRFLLKQQGLLSLQS